MQFSLIGFLLIIAVRCATFSDLLKLNASNLPNYTPKTATIQFAGLNTFPIAYAARYQSLHRHRGSIVTALLMLAGDIEVNPGPTNASLSICSLNIRSALKTRHP